MAEKKEQTADRMSAGGKQAHKEEKSVSKKYGQRKDKLSGDNISSSDVILEHVLVV